MPVEMPEVYADDLRLSMEREERMAEMNTIDRFDGEFAFLSNRYPAAVRIPGDEFPDTYRTVEHAYQAAKTLSRDERRAIREADMSGEAAVLGQVVKLRPGWDDIKVNVMRDLVWEKFTTHPELRAKLLATGDAEIVTDDELGGLLMETREKISKHKRAVLFAKRVAPELDLFKDMLSRARIAFKEDVDGENVVLTIENDDTGVDVTFSKNGYLMAISGYGGY